jgi:hypothetical protein
MYRADTRRLNAAGKMIGGHVDEPTGWNPGVGKFFKKLAHKAERQTWAKFAASSVLLPEDVEIKLYDKALAHASTECNWKHH